MPASGALPPRPGHAVCDDRSAEQAHAEFSAAIDLYRAMEMTFWIPETGASLAQGTAR